MLNDIQIKKLVIEDRLIFPFVSSQKQDVNGNGILSYGLSPFGYDIRLLDRDIFVIDENSAESIIDPKNFSPASLTEIQVIDREYVILQPKTFMLARSLEYIKMPTNLSAMVVGKSTYARIGVFLNTTPLEAGWEGTITLEIYNSLPLPVKIYVNEGIAQVVFSEGIQCDVPYNARNNGMGGKYQGQIRTTPPRV